MWSFIIPSFLSLPTISNAFFPSVPITPHSAPLSDLLENHQVMASHNFSSLREMLDKQLQDNAHAQSQSRNVPVAVEPSSYLARHQTPKAEIPDDDPHVTEMFGELYFKENSNYPSPNYQPKSKPNEEEEKGEEESSGSVGKPFAGEEPADQGPPRPSSSFSKGEKKK